MNEATIAQTVMTLLILLIFIGLLIWGIRSHQFRNVEDAKYRMLDNGEDDYAGDEEDTQQENKQT